MSIVERAIYAGDTPLFSDFTVAQTGPMQLTISSGDFQITGHAKILEKEKVPAAFLTDGRAEMMPDGKRVRAWLQDKATKEIKNKSKRRTLVGQTVIDVVSHPSENKNYRVDLRSPSDMVMLIQVQSWLEDQAVPVTNDLTHVLVFPFVVPSGTTDLIGITIQVFRVLPGFPAPTPEWET